ncbi:MAG: PEP-CTERM sorting domain-containing protein [bacterium]|nr:PEP-CTERM sorting domain-containing protein [bacterium]
MRFLHRCFIVLVVGLWSSGMSALPVSVDSLLGTYAPGGIEKRSISLETPSNAIAFWLRINFYSPGAYQLEIRFPGLDVDPIQSAGAPAVVWMGRIGVFTTPGDQFSVEIEFTSIHLPVDMVYAQGTFLIPEPSTLTLLGTCLTGLVVRRHRAEAPRCG